MGFLIFLPNESETIHSSTKIWSLKNDMFERVTYNVVMFQPYDDNCDVFYMRKYDFREPLPCSELLQIVKTKYSIAAWLFFTLSFFCLFALWHAYTVVCNAVSPIFHPHPKTAHSTTAAAFVYTLVLHFLLFFSFYSGELLLCWEAKRIHDLDCLFSLIKVWPIQKHWNVSSTIHLHFGE